MVLWCYIENMNLVRRSVAFPEDIYEALRLEAFSRRMSVNQLVVEKSSGIKVSRARDAVRDWEKLQAIGRKIKAEMGEVDVVKIIREERDRDNA